MTSDVNRWGGGSNLSIFTDAGRTCRKASWHESAQTPFIEHEVAQYCDAETDNADKTTARWHEKILSHIDKYRTPHFQ